MLYKVWGQSRHARARCQRFKKKKKNKNPFRSKYIEHLCSRRIFLFFRHVNYAKTHKKQSEFQHDESCRSNVVPFSFSFLFFHNLQDLERFVTSAERGVVYFSMGSIVKGSSITAEQTSAMLRAFGRLKGYKVLWKWENDPPPSEVQSGNVKFVPWMPQFDVLSKYNTPPAF